jgi:hypothetical protein
MAKQKSIRFACLSAFAAVVKNIDGVLDPLPKGLTYYTPTEMRWLLQTAGYVKVDIFGCYLGQFSREHALTHDDFEMLVVAETDL